LKTSALPETEEAVKLDLNGEEGRTLGAKADVMDGWADRGRLLATSRNEVEKEDGVVEVEVSGRFEVSDSFEGGHDMWLERAATSI
jgi:hypothetical protein